MNKNKKWEALWNGVRQICTILSVLFVVLYTVVSLLLPEVPNFLGKESLSKELNYAIIVVVFSGTMLFVLPCIIHIYLKLAENKLTKELTEITDKLVISKDHLEEIKGFSLIKKAELIKSKADFFKVLDKARKSTPENGNTEIRLMNFAKTIQEQQKEENARKYYKQEIDFCQERRDVKLFKIVSIHTKEKFIECWKMAKEAEKNELENFYLAYLHMSDFEEVTLPKIIGVQIIDDNVIFMHPTSARIDTADHREPIFIQSKEIAEIYSDYHRELWKEIKKYHKQWLARDLKDEEKKEYGYIGHILYTGEKKTSSEDRVWKDINDGLPKDERLNTVELAFIGIR